MNRSRSGAALGLAAVLAVWAAPAYALEAPAVTFTAPPDGAVLTSVTVSGRAEMRNPLNRITGVRVEVRSKLAGGDRVACVDGQCNVQLGRPGTPFSFSPSLTVNGPYEVTASATGAEVVDIDGPEKAEITRAFKLEVRPAPPGDVRAQANPDRTITVSWARNRERDLIGYQVQRKGPGPSAFVVVDSVEQTSGARLSLVDRKPAETGGAFEYVVLAVRRGADGTNANPVSTASAPSGVVSVAGPDGRTPAGGSPPGGTAATPAVLDVPSFLSKAGAGGPNLAVPEVEVPDGGSTQSLAGPESGDAVLGDDAEVALEEEESDSSERRDILIPVAAGLLLCVLAGHLRRLSHRTPASSAADEGEPVPETKPAPDERQWSDAVEAPAHAEVAAAGRRRRGRRRSQVGDDEVSQVVLGTEIDDLLAAGPTDDRRTRRRPPEPVAVPADVEAASEGEAEAASVGHPGEPVDVGPPAGRPAAPPDQAAETPVGADQRAPEPAPREKRRRRGTKEAPPPERDEELDARFEVLVAGAEADLDEVLGAGEAGGTARPAATGVTGEQTPGPPRERDDRARQLDDADASSGAAKADAEAEADAATARATAADAAAEAASSRAAAADAAADAAISLAAAAEAAAEAATSRATAAAIETAAIEAAAIEAAATIQAAAAEEAATAKEAAAAISAAAAAEVAAAKEAAATIEAAAAGAVAEATEAAVAAATIAATEAATEAATVAATEAAAAEATSAAVAAATIEATEAAVAAATIAATEAAVATATIEATEAAVAAATEAAVAAATEAAVAAATSAVGAAMVAMVETTAAEELSRPTGDSDEVPGDDVGAGDLPQGEQQEQAEQEEHAEREAQDAQEQEKDEEEDEEATAGASVAAVATPSAFGFGEEAVTAVGAEDTAPELPPEEPVEPEQPQPPEEPEQPRPSDEWADLLDSPESESRDGGTDPSSAEQSFGPAREPALDTDEAAGGDDADEGGVVGVEDDDGGDGDEGEAPEVAPPATAEAGDATEPDDDAWDSVVLVGEPPPDRDSPGP